MNPTLYFSTPNGSASQRRISFVSGRTWHDPTSWRKRRSASSWRLAICWHRPPIVLRIAWTMTTCERISNPDSLVMFPMLVIQHPRCCMGFYHLWLWHRFTRNMPIWLSVKGERKKTSEWGIQKHASTVRIQHLPPSPIFAAPICASHPAWGDFWHKPQWPKSPRWCWARFSCHPCPAVGLPQALVFSEPTFNFNLVDPPFCRWCFFRICACSLYCQLKTGMSNCPARLLEGLESHRIST